MRQKQSVIEGRRARGVIERAYGKVAKEQGDDEEKGPVRLKYTKEKRAELKKTTEEKLNDESATDAERLAAEAQLRAMEAAEIENEQVDEHFAAWLMGKGRDVDHARTPWKRTPLIHITGVKEILEQNSEKRWKFIEKLTSVKHNVEHGRADVSQLWLYYRFFIRGSIDPDSYDNIDFMKFWREIKDGIPEIIRPDAMYLNQKTIEQLNQYAIRGGGLGLDDKNPGPFVDMGRYERRFNYIQKQKQAFVVAEDALKAAHATGNKENWDRALEELSAIPNSLKEDRYTKDDIANLTQKLREEVEGDERFQEDEEYAKDEERLLELVESQRQYMLRKAARTEIADQLKEQRSEYDRLNRLHAAKQGELVTKQMFDREEDLQGSKSLSLLAGLTRDRLQRVSEGGEIPEDETPEASEQRLRREIEELDKEIGPIREEMDRLQKEQNAIEASIKIVDRMDEGEIITEYPTEMFPDKVRDIGLLEKELAAQRKRNEDDPKSGALTKGALKARALELDLNLQQKQFELERKGPFIPAEDKASLEEEIDRLKDAIHVKGLLEFEEVVPTSFGARRALQQDINDRQGKEKAQGVAIYKTADAFQKYAGSFIDANDPYFTATHKKAPEFLSAVGTIKKIMKTDAPVAEKLRDIQRISREQLADLETAVDVADRELADDPKAIAYLERLRGNAADLVATVEEADTQARETHYEEVIGPQLEKEVKRLEGSLEIFVGYATNVNYRWFGVDNWETSAEVMFEPLMDALGIVSGTEDSYEQFMTESGQRDPLKRQGAGTAMETPNRLVNALKPKREPSLGKQEQED